MSNTYPTQPDSAFHRVVDLHREVHELAAFVHQLTLGERFNMTAQDIRAVMDQFLKKTRRGIEIASCRTPRDLVDPPVRGRRVSHGASRPMNPHLDVASGSLWHCAVSTSAQFAGPEFHPYTE